MAKKLFRRFTACLAIILVGTAVSARPLAIDVGKFPKTPTLYAQSAVLMDAETGQVLYGKGEHQKLYPASLTKIMTCLLVMDNGRYEDVVTIDKEATKEVIGTSHIALTEGEQLTVEQLTYAMMLESANDAASALAIHLAGSIPMFGKLMNEKAAEIGAQESYFVNANGLPDNAHISSAYDLALITKEALKDPDFKKFAGSAKYDIPKTNKNEARTVNHKNYMFVLNDTYDGAFAGKTGWTQEAGHCLMTVAERNGITLICVVLRSDGVVDAEFKDSTALFDYGFDNFRRVNLPWSKFPSQQISYMGQDGGEHQGRLYPIGADMPILLPTGVEEDDLKMETVIPDQLSEADFSRVRVQLRLPEVAGEVMNRLAGDFPVEIRPLDLQAELGETSEEKPPFDWVKFGKTVLICAGSALLLGILAVLFIRYRVRRHCRRLLDTKTRRVSMNSDDLQYLERHEISNREMTDYRKSYSRSSGMLGVSGHDFTDLIAFLFRGKASGRKKQPGGKKQSEGSRRASGNPPARAARSEAPRTGRPENQGRDRSSGAASVKERPPVSRQNHAAMFDQDAVPPPPPKAPLRRPISSPGKPKEPPEK